MTNPNITIEDINYEDFEMLKKELPDLTFERVYNDVARLRVKGETVDYVAIWNPNGDEAYIMINDYIHRLYDLTEHTA